MIEKLPNAANQTFLGGDFNLILGIKISKIRIHLPSLEIAAFLADYLANMHRLQRLPINVATALLGTKSSTALIGAMAGKLVVLQQHRWVSKSHVVHVLIRDRGYATLAVRS